LSKCLDVFSTSPNTVVLVYPQCELINAAGTVLSRAPDSVDTRNRRASVRLAHVLKHVSYAYPVWGLHRSSSLKQTRLVGPVCYWDDILLAEVSLHGHIIEVPQVLSQQRCHKGNAISLCSAGIDSEAVVNPNRATLKTRKALLTWTDPSAKRIVWLPIHAERCLEYFKRIHHAPLPPLDKLLCYITVPIVCYSGHFRKFLGIWRRKLCSM
jgi:hypothetical protein